MISYLVCVYVLSIFGMFFLVKYDPPNETEQYIAVGVGYMFSPIILPVVMCIGCMYGLGRLFAIAAERIGK